MRCEMGLPDKESAKLVELRHQLEPGDEMAQQAKRCIFCSTSLRRRKSKEHVFARWLLRELDIEKAKIAATHRRSRAMGKRIGRPRAEVDVPSVVSLRNQCQSWRKIAHVLNVPVSRVRRAFSRHSPVQAEPRPTVG